MKITKLLLTALCACAIMISCTACGLPADSDADSDTYYASSPMGYNEYQLYVRETIAPVLNRVNSHLSKLSSVEKGSVSAELELKELESSIKNVESAITDITKTYPPKDFEDERELLLSQLATLKDVYSSYASEITDTGKLSANSKEIFEDNLQALFQGIGSII